MNSNDLSEVPNNQFGVYGLIFHTENGKRIYIGSTSISFRCRITRHLYDLKKGIHSNPHLINLWKKWGVFEISIMQICSKREEVIVEEQKFINTLSETGQLLNFGPAYPGVLFGRHRSIETREKIANALKGRPLNEERKERMRKARKGRTLTDEQKRKISIALKGRKPSAEHCLNVSKNRKGKGLGFGNNREPGKWKPTPEHLEKLHSKEARAKTVETKRLRQEIIKAKNING